LSHRVDLYSSYAQFSDRVLDQIRKETFGIDIGQNSWITVEEYDRFISWLNLTPNDHVLEIASGAGGPAIHLSRNGGCHVTGIDANPAAVETATEFAKTTYQTEKVQFLLADANAPLQFADNTFDGLMCIDAMNHLPDRLAVLREWGRVLRPGKRAVFTDPVVIAGPVTNDELALRGAVGLFLFVPAGHNEKLIEQTDLQLIRQEDVSQNAALIASRWKKAREKHKDELLQIEGDERYESLQRFFASVHKLTSEGRLARIVYVVQKMIN
jgi:SAM-dependent methyltransferase